MLILKDIVGICKQGYTKQKKISYQFIKITPLTSFKIVLPYSAVHVHVCEYFTCKCFPYCFYLDVAKLYKCMCQYLDIYITCLYQLLSMLWTLLKYCTVETYQPEWESRKIVCITWMYPQPEPERQNRQFP